MIDHYPLLFYYFTILYLFFKEDLEEGQKVSEGEQKDLRKETNGLMKIPKRNSPSSSLAHGGNWTRGSITYGDNDRPKPDGGVFLMTTGLDRPEMKF